MKNKIKNKELWTWVILGLTLGILLISFLSIAEDRIQQEEEWLTYENEEFNFQIKHPADWNVVENLDDELNPRVNFYKEGLEVAQPVTHHSDIPNVSVFPQGIPTEGVFGETRESSISTYFDFQEVTDFVLSDGTVWATYLQAGNFPSESWTESGFLWARTEIHDLELRCIREEEISMEECDPMIGDLVVRDGTINADDRITQREMLRSFRPLPPEEEVDQENTE